MNVCIINNHHQIPTWTPLFREKDVTPLSPTIYGWCDAKKLEWSTGYNCLSMAGTDLANQLNIFSDFFHIFSSLAPFLSPLVKICTQTNDDAKVLMLASNILNMVFK